MTPTDDQGPEGGLAQRVEVLLSSLTAVVSARVIFDGEGGAEVHIIATAEKPVSEVTRSVMSAFTVGLGFEVPSDHISVVQSSLSSEALRTLLIGSETADPPPSPAAPERATTRPPEPESPVPDTGLLEFSLGGTRGEPKSGSETELQRLQLQNLQLERHDKGGSESRCDYPTTTAPSGPNAKRPVRRRTPWRYRQAPLSG